MPRSIVPIHDTPLATAQRTQPHSAADPPIRRPARRPPAAFLGVGNLARQMARQRCQPRMTPPRPARLMPTKQLPIASFRRPEKLRIYFRHKRKVSDDALGSKCRAKGLRLELLVNPLTTLITHTLLIKCTKLFLHGTLSLAY